jgi:L-threonylcarbamoyladenylate synthase
MSRIISNCSFVDLDYAANSLMGGSLVAFPTETVYGLGADACNADAIARIYSVKGRPTNHPLIVHLASMDTLGDWAKDAPAYAISLAQAFWPGPMTLVFKRSVLAGDFLTGGQDSVGVRVPNHPIALGLLEAFAKVGGKGVAAPSANRFGNVSPTTTHAVNDELGKYLAAGDQILDGGECDVGIESTIIDCSGDLPKILRPGAISIQMIQENTKLIVASAVESMAIRVSGSLESHYAPEATVLLDQTPLEGQGFIAMADIVSGEGVVRLASPKSHEEFARVLYSALRAADEQGLKQVIVAQPIGDGLAVAIRDRLKRASSR